MLKTILIRTLAVITVALLFYCAKADSPTEPSEGTAVNGTWEGNDIKVEIREDSTYTITEFENGDVVYSETGTWTASGGDVTTSPNICRELDENDIVSSRLRELSISRKGPWSYQWDTVLISIPAKEFQPRPGFANVCESGKFLRNDLEVYNIDQTHSIKVTATGKYACPEGLKHPDIQLNVEDAIKLLGSSNFSKYETGIALISN